MELEDSKIKKYFNVFNKQFETIRNKAWRLGDSGLHKKGAEKDEFTIDTRGLDTIIESLENTPHSGLTMKTQPLDINDMRICMGGYELCTQALLFYFAIGEPPSKDVKDLIHKIEVDKSNPTFHVLSLSRGIQKRLEDYAKHLERERKDYRS
ncbi:hypothetical protein HOE04_05505 [archaeon]|mgnify:CR=1 FL=1|jgi:hypothetical protein|nr:hypothetical protein [archaeon]